MGEYSIQDVIHEALKDTNVKTSSGGEIDAASGGNLVKGVLERVAKWPPSKQLELLEKYK